MSSAHITQLFSSVLSQMLPEHRLIWLKNAGAEVIGFLPTWFLQVQSGSIINQTRTKLSTHTGVTYATLPQKKTATQENVTAIINAYILANSDLANTSQASANPSSANTAQTNNQHTAVAYENGLMGFVGYDYASGNIAPNISKNTATNAANATNTANTHSHPCPSLFFGHYDIYLKKHAGEWWLHFPDDVSNINDFVAALVEGLAKALQHLTSPNLPKPLFAKEGLLLASQAVASPSSLLLQKNTDYIFKHITKKGGKSPFNKGGFRGICKPIIGHTNFKTDTKHITQKQHLQLHQLQAQWQKADYAHAFYAVQDYLKAGDCYQANLAQRFTANYVGDPVAALAQLDAMTNAPYAGYLHLGDFQLISCSPELFVAFENGRHGGICMTTKPIKGTLPRLVDPHADQQQIAKLQASEKDQAENLMIVDLLRNDLSVFAKTGSVSVPKLFEIESFAQVHHLVSTVTAMLDPAHSSFDVLMNALPGGSITGAPKVRAIEVIHELENHPRGAYCGSMGFLNFSGTGSFNILIRTLEFFQGEMALWAGGGITIASECAAEYQECLDKISGILAVLKAFEAGK